MTIKIEQLFLYVDIFLFDELMFLRFLRQKYLEVVTTYKIGDRSFNYIIIQPLCSKIEKKNLKEKL